MEEEFIWLMAWQRAVGLTFLRMLVPVVGCYVGLIVAFFRRREWPAAILCTFCLIFCPAFPAGVLIALVFGWLNAGRWGMRAFMAVWTGLVVLAVADLVVAVALRDMDGATARRLFGS